MELKNTKLKARTQQAKITNERGFSLLELIIALGIMTLIGAGITTLIRRQMEAAQYTEARQFAQAEIERVFGALRKAWLGRRQTSTDTGFAIIPAGSSTNNVFKIIMSGRNSTTTTPKAFSSWRTVCRDIPPALNLKAGVVNSLATMAATNCGVTCNSGQRPVVEFNRGIAELAGDINLDGVVDAADINQLQSNGLYNSGQPATWAQGDFNGDGVFDILDMVVANANSGSGSAPAPIQPSAMTPPEPGNVVLIPADTGGGPSREAILGFSACFASGSAIAITFKSGFLNPKGELQIFTRQSELRMENEYGSGVEVLR